MAEAQAEYRAFAQLLQSLPGRVHDADNLTIDIEALHSTKVAGAAISATDAWTWQSQPIAQD